MTPEKLNTEEWTALIELIHSNSSFDENRYFWNNIIDKLIPCQDSEKRNPPSFQN